MFRKVLDLACSHFLFCSLLSFLFLFPQCKEKSFAFFTDKTAHRGVILTEIPVNYHIYVVYIFKHLLSSLKLLATLLTEDS